jgi:hypothetical protein
MTTPQVGTLAELRPSLREALSSLRPAVQDEVIEQLPGVLEQATPPPEAAKDRHVEKDWFGEAYFAVHDEDLNLLGECAKLAVACLTLFSNPAGVIADLVLFLFRYRSKRAQLTAQQGAVLLSLKKAPPAGWTVEELAARLPFKSPPPAAELRQVLESLTCVLKSDGTTTAFAGEKEGRWRAIDV